MKLSNKKFLNIKKNREHFEINLDDNRKQIENLHKDLEEYKRLYEMTRKEYNLLKDQKEKMEQNKMKNDMNKGIVNNPYKAMGIIEVKQESEDTNKLSHIFAKVFSEINKQSDKYFIQTRKKVIILPKSFLDFIEFFITFKEKYSHKLEEDIKKYKWGVIL